MNAALLRIETLGTFRLLRLTTGSNCYEEIPLKGLSRMGPPLTFLKVLFATESQLNNQKLSRYQASKDCVIDALWPEEDSVPTDVDNALSHAKSTLNRALRPFLGDQDLILRIEGSDKTGYQLNLALVAIDIDEFDLLCTQAGEAEGRGDEDGALQQWEAAYALVQGDFLPQDQYNEWSKVRRERLTSRYRLCLHRLATLYMQRHRIVEAIGKLHPYVLKNPADTDLLSILLPLLAQQSCYQEALELLRRCQEDCEQNGREIGQELANVETYIRHAQTTKLAISHSASFQHTQSHHFSSVHEHSAAASDPQQVRQTSQIECDDVNKTVVQLGQESSLSIFNQYGLEYLFEEGMRAISLAGQKAHWSIEDIHRKMDQEFRYNNYMDKQEHVSKTISRRDMLLLLTGLSGAVMGLDLSGTALPLQPEEITSLCLTTIPACWGLVYTGSILHVEKVLPKYLAGLTTVVSQSSHHRQVAANLASQGYKLANLLALQREDFSTALKCSQSALMYGEVAGSSNLQVAALIEEALTFWYRKRPVQTLATYQKALLRIQGVSPIIAGRVYVGLAEASAKLGHEQEALRYMGLAQEIFPEHPEQDDAFAYTHYSRYYLNLYKGLMYTNLRQPTNALEAYAHFHVPEYVARRAEIANREAATLLTLGDLHQCYDKVTTAVSFASSMNSDLRYSEAYEVWQGMLLQWPHEAKVKELIGLFQK